VHGKEGPKSVTDSSDNAAHGATTQKLEGTTHWRTKPAFPGSSEPPGPFATAGPMLTRDTVVVQSSRPTSLWGVLKSTGELLWNRQFGGITGLATDDNCVYLTAERRLICADALTGETRWASRPWQSTDGPDLDLAVSRGPAVSEGRIFWASTSGLIKCGDAHSGAELWRARRPNGVLSSLAIIDGKVIGTELPSVVFALDASSGRLGWSRVLPARSLRRPLGVFGGVVLRLAESLLLLGSADGTLLTTWSWPGELVGHVATGNNVAFAARCEKEDSIFEGKHSVIPGKCQVVRLLPGGSTLWQSDSVTRGPQIVWDERRAVLWEACGGLAIRDAATGSRTHMISLANLELHLPPAVDEDCIYLVTADAELVALTSPV
jgi:hypothetical protein